MEEVAALSRGLLAAMVDPSTGLFPYKATWVAGEMQNAGTNALYSAISAIGLLLDEAGDGDGAALSLDATLDSLYEIAHAAAAPDVIATTMWALMLAGDTRASTLHAPLERRFVPAASSSMEVGLVLGSIGAVLENAPHLHDVLGPTATRAVDELIRRFSDTAQLFAGHPRRLRPRHSHISRMTSFASQVYPIHGLTRYARATETDPPEEALRAADALVESQGPFGQWWWIYSTRSGDVLEPYPVYSVHQDAMAFMALAPLQNLGLRDYEDALARGLAWLFGTNELETPLIDVPRQTVFRAIQRHATDPDGRWGMSLRQRAAVTSASWLRRGTRVGGPDVSKLEVLEEVRPYHLGWALYARDLTRSW